MRFLSNVIKITIAYSLLISSSFTASAKTGVELYQQCIACHGDKGQGNTQLNAPAIAGQSENYTSRQLLNFASSIRGEHPKDSIAKPMVAFAKMLDKNKDVPVLASYLATLPKPETSSNQVKGDLKNGSRYYQGKCGACHGGQAEGNESFNAPRLQGLSTQYLNRQMSNFVNGLRGTHQQDKFGRQMAMMAKTTSGKELEDILYYISLQK